MAHGGRWRSPRRLPAVELGPSKVARTNIPDGRGKFLFEPYGPNLWEFSVTFTPGLATA